MTLVNKFIEVDRKGKEVREEFNIKHYPAIIAIYKDKHLKMGFKAFEGKKHLNAYKRFCEEFITEEEELGDKGRSIGDRKEFKGVILSNDNIDAYLADKGMKIVQVWDPFTFNHPHIEYLQTTFE